MAATRASGPGVCQSRKCGCSVPIRNALSTGRFDVLSEVGYDPTSSDYDQSDHDLDIPMLMVLEGGDVPRASALGAIGSHLKVPMSSTSVSEPEYPQDWMKEKVNKITEKNVKAHDKKKLNVSQPMRASGPYVLSQTSPGPTSS